jgi:hypothetical protein
MVYQLEHAFHKMRSDFHHLRLLHAERRSHPNGLRTIATTPGFPYTSDVKCNPRQSQMNGLGSALRESPRQRHGRTVSTALSKRASMTKKLHFMLPATIARKRTTTATSIASISLSFLPWVLGHFANTTYLCFSFLPFSFFSFLIVSSSLSPFRMMEDREWRMESMVDLGSF